MTIWVDQETNLRVNIYAPYKGRSKLDTAEIRAEVGIVEITTPPPPQGALDNPDHYYRTDQQDAPYVVWTLKSQEQIDAIEAQKIAQQAKVNAKGEVEADIVCTYLRTHTPLETYQYIQTNVTNLQTAKDIIGKLAAAVGVLLRE